MKQIKKKRRWWKWGLALLLSPILLFFIIAILIYIPPVQQFIVNKVTEELSEQSGLEMSIGKVRLAFPLDLAVHDVLVVEEPDTLADIRAMRLKVKLYPLFKGMVDVDGLEVYDAQVNSGSWIPDLYLRGRIHKFAAATHGVNLKTEEINLDYAKLDGTDLFVALSDTAVSEPSEPSMWNILVEKVELGRTHLRISLPGDSMRIGFQANRAFLDDGQIDLGKSIYHVGNLKLLRGGLTYAVRTAYTDSLMRLAICEGDSLHLCPDSVGIAATVMDSVRDTLALESFKMGNLAFSESDSLLWMGFVPMSEGIDPNYIVLDNLNFALGNINYGPDGQMSLGVRNFFLTERSGAQIDHLEGNILLSKGKLCLSDFTLSTPSSVLNAKSEIWLDSILGGSNDYGRLEVKGEVSPEDVRTLGKGFVSPSILERWPDSPLKLNLAVEGTTRTLQLDTFKIDWPNIAKLKIVGEVLHPFSEERVGKVDFNLRTYGLDFVHSLMANEGQLDMQFPKGFAISGRADVNGSAYALTTQVLGDDGKIGLKGKVNTRSESYEAEIKSEHFPLRTFMPGVGLSPLTARVEAKGKGFDFFKETTELQASMSLDTLKYVDWELGHIGVNVNFAQGRGQVDFVSENDLLEGEGLLEAKLGDILELKLNSEIPNLNLAQLMDLDKALTFGTSLSLDFYTDKNFSAYGIGGGLSNIRFITEDKGIPARDLYFSFDSTVDTTLMTVSSGDMEMSLAASGNVDKITKDLGTFFSVFEEQIRSQQLDQAALKDVAPTLQFHLYTGGLNPIVNLFKEMGYDYRMMDMVLSVSPEKGATGDLSLSRFSMGKNLFDTVSVHLQQDTTGLVANAWVKNYQKKNPTKFEGSLKSYLLDSGAGVELMIKNRDGITGMNLGVLADFTDDGMKIHLYPEHPVIAFRDFTVNRDNYLFFGKDSTVRADVNLLASDGTGFGIYSQPADSVNDLTLSLNNLNLESLAGISASLPDLKGIFSGDVHLIDDHKNLSVMSALNVENLVLEGAPLGNMGAEVIYLPQDSTLHHASIFISANDEEILALNGLYSIVDQKENFEGSAELLNFPLELLNGFLVGTDLAMEGKANGNLVLNGDMGKPDLNGELQFSEARMYSEVYGFDFRMDEQPVRIVNNQMVVKDYALDSYKSNNPLLLNGTLDMRNLSNVKMDFSMKARNFELINAKKQSKSLVFGKVYADFDGSMKGSLENLSIRGKLSILARTDMTYVLKDSPLTVDDRLHDLVKFVDFEEAEVYEEPVIVPSSNFNMTLGIQISDAALFHCNLSEDGSNYVDLEGGGDLTLRLTQQGDMRLTGRFTANSGEMKYSLPVIPLKTFKLVRGSYVDFTGDVENPTLNIAAKERMKAMVTENDQPRSVAFDVGVSITQPLDRMGLEFTIEAPEDLTIQNQLAAMTKAERGKAAVGMLATGMYLTDESLSSSTSGFKASNALTAFLQSEIQNIAGSALKTIDLTIGMENNTSVTGATTTDYSFQFAKRFWGNRISVIVGGKVSTGAEAENSAESFIDNIAVEYRLDKTASRYVRVFYERSFQDPLEGQLTKTGAGLMLRKKSDKLGDLFIFRNRESKKKSDKKSKDKN